MNVPFADLHAQYLTIKDGIDAAIADVIRTSAFIRGPYVQRFEEEFAAAMQLKHCVSCANGTDSLYIAMHGLGVKPGDEVIAPAHSWISTTETITQAGGTVVFCDTDTRTYTIDPAQVKAKTFSRAGSAAGLSFRRMVWIVVFCACRRCAVDPMGLVNIGGTSVTPAFRKMPRVCAISQRMRLMKLCQTYKTLATVAPEVDRS